MVVKEYIAGESSAFEVAAKYKLSNADILLRWVSVYK